MSSQGIKSSLDREVTSIVDIKQSITGDQSTGGSIATKKRIPMEERLKKYESIGVPTISSSNVKHA